MGLRKFNLALLAFSVILMGCGKNDDANDPSTEQLQLPAKAIGILPENGEPCSDFQEISNNVSKVSVRFGWDIAEFTQNYELKVFENLTEVISTSVDALGTDVILDRGKTYNWSLKTINSEGETQGDTYSFTTPGTPIGNYAPYAADITLDFNISTMKLSVSWVGRDEDGDMLLYDVTVKENDEIISEALDTIETTISTINFTSRYTYTVKVTSKDGAGNFSISESKVSAPE